MPDPCGPGGDPARSRLMESGAGGALKDAKPEQILAAIDEVLSKLKAEAPDTTNDDLINGLTASYCRNELANSKLSAADRAAQIGNFSVLVYSQIVSPVHRD
jgi:hypothetical protein